MTQALAKRSKQSVAIDPDEKAISTAQQAFSAGNLRYQIAAAQSLPFENSEFDVALFSLSFHHVPVALMERAINEAVRVTKSSGYIVFLEPGYSDNFFDAELLFNASDGDERLKKPLLMP